MCGIAGQLLSDLNARVARTEIEAMLLPMAYRGPDGQGVHLDRNVGIGHLRLSIIDLDTGSQPMANEDQTVWIVFNGEIYNFQVLREDLINRGHTFHSRSDTEVIIHLYEEFGTECVRRLQGMFAFAIWDAKIRRLFLARDRVGIKPLYYCETAGALYFGSELKSIIADPAVSRDTDPNALRAFFSFYYIPGEATPLKSVRKLLPGHYLVAENAKVSTHQYWDLIFTKERWTRSFESVVEELYELLGATVRSHMIADVPVGVLLSGGMDSSAVLSFAAQSTNKKVKAFTVGFEDNQVVDERPYARMAAATFGIEHHELSMTANDFWNFLPSYVWHMEEPVCEPPAVALHFVSHMARKHVKVLLSGEGGDEAFAGYPNYPNMLRLQRICQALGPFARPAGAMVSLASRLIGNERLERYGDALGRPLAEHYFSRSSSPNSYFNRMANSFFSPAFLSESRSFSTYDTISRLLEPVRECALLDQLLYIDTKSWLPDDLLIKADKITMANSLELRVPLLDHTVLEFAASLPTEFKVKGKETKRVLKAAFSRILPSEVINRKKVGFPVPYNSWLRGELNGRLRALLLSDRAVSRHRYRKGQVELLLEHHYKTGTRVKEVFSLLILELWDQRFSDYND